jgi:hypothetical protein
MSARSSGQFGGPGTEAGLEGPPQPPEGALRKTLIVAGTIAVGSSFMFDRFRSVRRGQRMLTATTAKKRIKAISAT